MDVSTVLLVDELLRTFNFPFVRDTIPACDVRVAPEDFIGIIRIDITIISVNIVEIIFFISYLAFLHICILSIAKVRKYVNSPNVGTINK